MDDEIDLRQYILVLVRYRKWIIGVTAIAVIVAAIWGCLRPLIYEASALVVVTNPRYVMQFEPKIESTDTSAVTNPKVYLGLASTDDLLTQLLADPATGSLPDEARTLRGLRDTLSVAAQDDPNLLKLSVTDEDPQRAAAIVNAWGGLFVRYVNELLRPKQGEQASFAGQVVEAQATYDAAQGALEDFAKRDRSRQLQSEIESREALLQAYNTQQVSSVTGAVDAHLDSQLQILEDCYAELASVEQLLSDARALRSQVGTPSRSAAAGAGDALALMLLRSRTYRGTYPQLLLDAGALAPPQLQGAVSAADVDSLIKVLEGRRADAQERVDALAAATQLAGSVAPKYPLGQVIDQVSEEIRSLTATMEADQARRQELTEKRDIAFETLGAVTRKAAEASIAAQINDAEVRLASQASPPSEPTAGRLGTTVRAGVLAGAAAAIVSILAVLFIEYWRQGEPANPRQAMEDCTKRS